MPTIAFLLLATLRDTFRSRVALQLEVLALRQQLATMKRSASRSSLRSADRLFWVLLSRLWPAWRATLVIVRPETVITWHRKSYVRKLVTELSGGVFGYLDSVLERHSFDEFGELI